MKNAQRIGLSALLLTATAGLAQATLFCDGTFVPSNWSQTTITNASGAGSTSFGLTFPSGGNPTDYMRIRNNLVVSPALNGGVFGLYLNTTAQYDPSSSGAITSIAYSEDSINFVNQGGNGQGSGLLIQQGTQFFIQRTPILVMPFATFSNWVSQSASLSSLDLEEVDITGTIISSSHPDFSASGALMTFGFWRGNSANGNINTDCGIDNWCVNVIPAPSSLAVMGLGGLLVARRRR